MDSGDKQRAVLDYYATLEKIAGGDQILIERCRKGRAEALGEPYAAPVKPRSWWARIVGR